LSPSLANLFVIVTPLTTFTLVISSTAGYCYSSGFKLVPAFPKYNSLIFASKKDGK